MRPVNSQGVGCTAYGTHFIFFIGPKHEMEKSEQRFLEGSTDMEEHGVQRGGL